MAFRRILARMFVLAVLSCAGRAWADAPIELVYLRSGKAEVCPDKATLEKAVGKRLGYQPFFAAAERKLIAELSSKGNQLQARATLVDQAGVVRGSRQLTAPAGDCAELIASLALAISITLDPMSTASPQTPSAQGHASSAPASKTDSVETGTSAPVASNETTGSVPSTPPAPHFGRSSENVDQAAPEQPGSPAARWNVASSLGMSANVGVLPRLSPGFRGGIEVSREYGALGIEVTGMPAVTRDGEGGAYAEMSLLFASLVPCAFMGRVGACAALSLGRWQGEGHNVIVPREEAHLYASAGLRIMGNLPLTGPLTLRVYGGGATTLTRPSFELAGAELWRPPPFTVEAAAALSLLFL